VPCNLNCPFLPPRTVYSIDRHKINALEFFQKQLSFPKVKKFGLDPDISVFRIQKSTIQKSKQVATIEFSDFELMSATITTIATMVCLLANSLERSANPWGFANHTLGTNELEVYRDRTGLFRTNRSEVRRANMKKIGVNLTRSWILGILVAMMLVTGGIETNPGPLMEEKMEGLLGHIMGQGEGGKRIRELLEKNKTSMEKFKNINYFGTKIDQLSQSAKAIKEERGRIKNLERVGR
jgi:hypothetical protein